MKTKLLMVLAALFIAAAFTNCAKKDDNIVLRVEDREYTVDEFRELANRRFGGPQMAADKSVEELKAYAEEIAEAELKTVDARNAGYANRPDVVSAYEEARRMAAVGELYTKEIIDKMFPEAELRRWYEMDAQEVRASHILIRMDDDTDSVQAWQNIALIEKELRADGTVDSSEFAMAALQYNEDTSAQNGDLGWFRRGTMVQSFEDSAFVTQAGQLSNPVWTPFGWHLLFVHEFRPVPDRVTFEEDRERIMQLAMRARSQELMDSARAYVHSLEAERKVEFNMANLETIFSALERRLPHADPFSLLTEEQLALPLATYDTGQVNGNDFRPYVRQYLGGRNIEGAQMLQQLLENYITEKVLLPDRAQTLGYNSSETVLEQARQAADARIRQLVNQDRSRVPEPTDEQLRSYYDEHAQEYMVDAQYTIVEVLVTDRKLADQIAEKAKAGENLGDLAVKHSERPGAKEKKGVLGPIRKAQYGSIGRNAAETEIGQVVGPIRFQNSWSVFKVISKEEPRPDEFDNVRNKVKVDWREATRKEQLESWTDSLRHAIKYDINEDAIRKAFPESPESTEQVSAEGAEEEQQ